MNIRPCFVEINMNTLVNNFINIKKQSKKEVIAVVKANAYGHGAIEISKALIKAGASMLAVATVEEAIELRSCFASIPILILGPVADYQKEICIENSISIIACSLDEVKYISTLAKSMGKNALVHIALDTGMSRIGHVVHSLDNKIIDDISVMLSYKNIDFEGIFTHFSCADELDMTFTYKQYERFKFVVENLKNKNINFKYIHCQNSAATINLEDSVCNYVRAGISLYGYYPSNNVPKNLNIKPILTWKCRISHVKKLPKNTPIGYGATYITEKESVIATIPVGYADGFKRSLSNKFNVIINDVKIPIVGNVCMDQTMLDVTGLDCSVGDYVYLLSENNSADDIAKIDGTISYEILCGISSRVPRIYL